MIVSCEISEPDICTVHSTEQGSIGVWVPSSPRSDFRPRLPVNPPSFQGSHSHSSAGDPLLHRAEESRTLCSYSLSKFARPSLFPMLACRFFFAPDLALSTQYLQSNVLFGSNDSSIVSKLSSNFVPHGHTPVERCLQLTKSTVKKSASDAG